MWYFIYAEDIPNSNALRQEARPMHVERLKKLQDENRL